MKSWAASLALHGIVVWAVVFLWLNTPHEKSPTFLRWNVALVAPEPKPAPQPTLQKKPPRQERKRVEPRPRPKPVTPAPAPVPEPRPVPNPTPPDPEPAQAVTHEAPVQAVAQAAPEPVSEPQAKPVSQPDEAAHAEAVKLRWYQALMDKLRVMRRYPMLARRLGQEGVVLVEARFDSDGGLLGLRLMRGSGFPLLDRDAMRLVEAAATATRGELRPGQPARLEIPIAYRLEG